LKRCLKSKNPMKAIVRQSAIVCSLFVWLLAALPAGVAQVLPESTGIAFKTISGNVEFSNGSDQWQPLNLDSKLGSGSLIRTHSDSTLDFYLNESKTTLRLTPDSKLAIKTLKCWQAGDQDVTDTELQLLAGGIVGAQKN